jgi:starch synthase
LQSDTPSFSAAVSSQAPRFAEPALSERELAVPSEQRSVTFDPSAHTPGEMTVEATAFPAEDPTLVGAGAYDDEQDDDVEASGKPVPARRAWSSVPTRGAPADAAPSYVPPASAATSEVSPAPAELEQAEPRAPELEPQHVEAHAEPAWQPPPGPLHPGIPSMYVVHITSELAPVAKVGGLADVVFGITRELAIRGNHVEIILPKYDCMRYDQIWGLTPVYNDLWVPWWGGKVHCTVFYGEVHGRKCFFIEPHGSGDYFWRRKFYGDNDDVLRFAFFSRAALEFLYKTGRHPDIIHCHDWQTALVPVFLYEIYQHLGMHKPRVCYTIHNFKHQGVTGEFLLWATELGRPGHFFTHERLRDNHNATAINLMKGGIVYSNFVTTVSPNYAWEAKHGQGHGLDHTLHVHGVKYGGVVNGIDYDVWNPEIDHYIPSRYSVHDLDRKYENKRALRNRFWLADNQKPIVAFIGRLDEQKGLELIQSACWWCVRNGAQFVLLGTAPDPRVGHQFWDLKKRLNDSPDCHIELSFNEELSHLIYAGADMMLVPSRFEPCGLTQLIAMRYGTVPVVRAVGGLADTVFDKDHDWRPLDQRNGYVFQHYDGNAIESTLHRAVSCYYEYPQHFRDLMQNGMRYDYSWNFPGQHYLNIYDHIRSK